MALVLAALVRFPYKKLLYSLHERSFRAWESEVLVDEDVDLRALVDGDGRADVKHGCYDILADTADIADRRAACLGSGGTAGRCAVAVSGRRVLLIRGFIKNGGYRYVERAGEQGGTKDFRVFVVGDTADTGAAQRIDSRRTDSE